MVLYLPSYFQDSTKVQDYHILQQNRYAALKHLKNIDFACEDDARSFVEKWKQENPYCSLGNVQISEVSKKENVKRGRPRKDEKVIKYYVIDAEVSRNEEFIQHEA